MVWLVHSFIFYKEGLETVEGVRSDEIVILIDEYDQPITHLLKIKTDSADAISDFYARFFSTTFKDNKIYSNAIIAGIMRTSSGVLTQASFETYSVLNNEFLQFFGFSKNEVNEFRKHIEVDDAVLKRATAWFNGIVFNG